jgi:hypothetical protein
MLEPSTREEGFGCLGSILGMLVGGWLGLQHFGAHVRQQLVENPDAAVSGTPALAAMGLGAVVGVLAGAVVGMSVSRLLPGERPPPDRPKSGPRKDL